MKIHKFFVLALLSVLGTISLNADSSMAALEKRVADLEKRVAKLEKNTLYVSQSKLFADLQEEATALQQKMMTDFTKKQTEVETQMKALEAKKKDSKDPKSVEAEMTKLQQQFAQQMQVMQAEGKKQDDALKGKADQIMADFVKAAKERGYNTVQFTEALLGAEQSPVADEIIKATSKKSTSTLQKIENKVENAVKKIEKAL